MVRAPCCFGRFGFYSLSKDLSPKKGSFSIISIGILMLGDFSL